MFRILWDPFSGSIKLASLKLLVMFCVRSRCLAAWFFWPVVCVSGATSCELLFSTRRTRHTHNTGPNFTLPNTGYAHKTSLQSSPFNTPWGWIPEDPKHVGVFNCLLKYRYNVDFNLMSFIQLGALVGK